MSIKHDYGRLLDKKLADLLAPSQNFSGLALENQISSTRTILHSARN